MRLIVNGKCRVDGSWMRILDGLKVASAQLPKVDGYWNGEVLEKEDKRMVNS